jgi:cell wall-associated NlpC family hydrolase
MKNITIFVFSMLFTATVSCGYAQKEQDKTITESDSIVEQILNTAYDQIGVPYKYAGRHPDTGFDCSGFVHYVFKQHGYDLPVRSRDYVTVGEEMEKADCKPGDIILFAGSDPKKTPVGHVGIVTQNADGEILFIHSATSANRGIVISRASLGYYRKRFAGIRRLNYDNY